MGGGRWESGVQWSGIRDGTSAARVVKRGPSAASLPLQRLLPPEIARTHRCRDTTRLPTYLVGGNIANPSTAARTLPGLRLSPRPITPAARWIFAMLVAAVGMS
jgi:hypothetical protein